jgi:hypothetical protein
MRVLVCGGRDFLDASRVNAVLGRLWTERGPITCLIQGGARGGDWMAAQWAKARGVTVAEFPADWKRYGRHAGPIRNRQMLEEGKPDLVVSFPGGRGTRNMVDQAEAAGLEVIRG